MQEPLPSANTAFSIISREESHRSGSTTGNSSKTQSSVFATKGPDLKKKNGKGSVLVCKHCL